MALVESIGDPNADGFVVVRGNRWQSTTPAIRTRCCDGAQLSSFFPDESSEQSGLSSSDPRWRRRWFGAAWGRFQKGLPGWAGDFDRAMAITEQSDALSQSAIITYKYAGIPRGVFLADEPTLREIESALNAAERSSDDMAIVLLTMTFGDGTHP